MEKLSVADKAVVADEAAAAKKRMTDKMALKDEPPMVDVAQAEYDRLLVVAKEARRRASEEKTEYAARHMFWQMMKDGTWSDICMPSGA